MGKKKKNKLNKLLKAQQLQQISIGQIIPEVASTPSATVNGPVSAATSSLAPHEIHLSREILRTVISLLIVAALLVVAVIIDHRTNYFSTFGSWLYKTLRLANK